jgi:hypothetical protein
MRQVCCFVVESFPEAKESPAKAAEVIPMPEARPGLDLVRAGNFALCPQWC